MKPRAHDGGRLANMAAAREVACTSRAATTTSSISRSESANHILVFFSAD